MSNIRSYHNELFTVRYYVSGSVEFGVTGAQVECFVVEEQVK
jgi:hypothetical protein